MKIIHRNLLSPRLHTRVALGNHFYLIKQGTSAAGITGETKMGSFGTKVVSVSLHLP